MSSTNDALLKTLESIGPKVFNIYGSVCLWTQIIGSEHTNAITSLFDLLDNQYKTCEDKYELATRILTHGFGNVLDEHSKDLLPPTPTPSLIMEVTEIDESSDEQVMVIDDDFNGIDYSQEVKDNDNKRKNSTQISEDNNDKCIQQITTDCTTDCTTDGTQNSNQLIDEDIEEMDECIIPNLSQESQPIDSSGSYVEASTQQLNNILSTPDSYQSCQTTPDNNIHKKCDNNSSESNVDESIEERPKSPLEIQINANVDNLTPIKQRINKQLSHDRNNHSLCESPITSLSSTHRMSTLSPTLSNAMSSPVSSCSPKSMSSRSSRASSCRSASKRLAFKSHEQTIGEYNSIIPYEVYTSEQQYLKMMSPNSSTNNGELTIDKIPDEFIERVIEQNVKELRKSDS